MYRSGVLQIDQLEDQVQGRDKISDAPSDKPRPMCGFQLEFVSTSQVINHMTCYKFACPDWRTFYLKKKIFTRFSLLSEYCNFNY